MASADKTLRKKHFYRFGPFRLEPDERTLLRGGKPVIIPGGDKAFELLVLLVRNSGSLVRRERIVREVWPDTFVGEENLINVHISNIRKALGEEHIQTIAKHGYRFTTEVTEGFDEIAQGAISVSRRSYTKRYLVAIAATVVVLAGGRWFLHHDRNPAGRTSSYGLYQDALKYERDGDDEQALATLDQALQDDKGNEPACLRAAFLAYELQQDEDADKYLQGCNAVASKEEAIRLKAQALRETLAGNTTRALELYQLLIDRYPTDTDGLYRFSELATDIDRLEEAEKAARLCLTVEANNPYCHFQLMYVMIKQNRFGDVIAYYKALPLESRQYVWLDEPVGVAYLGNGQLDRAVQRFERLSENQRKLHGTTHFTVGKEWIADVLLFEGRVNEASARIQQMMETRDNASTRSGDLAYLAHAYLLAGNKVQARKFAAEAAQDDSDGSIEAALVLASAGDVAEAEAVLKSDASLLSPNNEHLLRGVVEVAKGNTTIGVAEIRLAYEFDPRDEEAAYQLGMAYFRSQNYRAAIEMFRIVEQLKGIVLLDNVPLLLPVSIYRAAECQERLGDFSGARSQFARVSDMWSSGDTGLRDEYPRIGGDNR